MISVIVPVYKVEKYLEKCVNSIRSQSYSDLEIILVDDGSPDNCGKICDEMALNDQRIRVPSNLIYRCRISHFRIISCFFQGFNDLIFMFCTECFHCDRKFYRTISVDTYELVML